jgi:hypothetical protein
MVRNIQRAVSQVRPVFPNETLRFSWDVQAVCQNFRLHPSLSIHHVKGQQDRTADLSPLPIPAQLIQADLLATAFHQTVPSDHDPHQMFLETGCQLVIDGQTIPSNHRRRIHSRRGHYRLLQYIQEKTQTTEEAFIHRLGESC